MHWGEFLCAAITSLVVGIPFVMYHTDAIELGAALMGLSGFILATTALMCALPALTARARPFVPSRSNRTPQSTLASATQAWHLLLKNDGRRLVTRAFCRRWGMGSMHTYPGRCAPWAARFR